MKDMIRHIRDAVKSGSLKQPFRAAEVIEALKQDNEDNEPIYYVGNFMWKHSQVGTSSVLFIKEAYGLYKLR